MENMRYLVVDAALHGTGVRDYYAGGYVELNSLELSDELIKKIDEWLLKYENEHYNSFKNMALIEQLDKEGKEIAHMIKSQLDEVKIDYYSAAKLIKDSI